MRYFSLLLVLAAGVANLFATSLALGQGNDSYDVVINHGRVIDPETKLDAVRHVGIKGDKIAAVSATPLTGKRTIDAKGLIVAPGFVDIHTHGQCIPADRMQAFDGVTTSLELELGMLPIARWYDIQKKTGRVLNYGASASWMIARIAAHEKREPQPSLNFVIAALILSRNWVANVSTPEQEKQILERLERALNEGGIGIGFAAGYVPGYGYKEMLAVHQLAARYKVPTFTHIRNFSIVDPDSSVQAYGELISYSIATGSHVHICHFNSTSLRDIDLAARMIRDAQKRGANVTVEAYPFGAASTVIGAVLLSPDSLKRNKLTASDIEYRGKPLTEESYQELRKNSPGEAVIYHFLRLPRDQELLDESVLFPGGIIASDAMPWTDTATGKTLAGDIWPLPNTAFSHPRSTATFTTFLTNWIRDRKKESLIDAIARCSYRPAKLLEESTPQLKRKGRLQAGMDADVVVFDLEGMKVRSTFTEPNQTTLGMKHVFVNGVPIISEGELDTKVFPGVAVRRPIKSAD